MNAYDASYLYDAVRNLADATDYAVNFRKIPIEEFYECLRISGIADQFAEANIRNIQQYEQRKKDIKKASVETVIRLAKALSCDIKDVV